MFFHTIAHLGGRVSSALVGFVLTTLVATHLGAAAMGVYGLYMVIQGLVGILDGGMSTSINRAMAIGHAASQKAGNKDEYPHGLLRAYEGINLTVSVLIALGVWAFLPWILEAWAEGGARALSAPSLALYAGGAMALRFGQTLYQNALFGAGKHGHANGIIGLFALVRVVPIALGIVFFKAELGAVFALLALSNGLEAMALIDQCRRQGLWRAGTKPDWRSFKAMASFMAPISGYTVIALLLSQADRIVMGQFISLEQFGFYALIAGYAAGFLSLAYAPGNVFYPLITQAVHGNDTALAQRAVSRTVAMIVLLIFPACLWTVFYAGEISALLFQDPALALQVSPLWVPLFSATLFQVLSIVPFKILLALGRADLIFKTNLFMLALYPFGLACGLFLFGYPDGLFALPALAALSFLLFLWFLFKSYSAARLVLWALLTRGAGAAGALAVYYGGVRLLFETDSAAFAEGSLWVRGLGIGWPLALAGLAGAALVWADLRKSQTSERPLSF